MKNNTLAIRITESFRADLENIAQGLDVSVSQLTRWMVQYCVRQNRDMTAYEPKSDFVAFANRQKATTLF